MPSKLINRLCDLIEALTDEKMMANSFTRTYYHHEHGQKPPLWEIKGYNCGQYFSKVPVRELVKLKHEIQIINHGGDEREVIIVGA